MGWWTHRLSHLQKRYFHEYLGAPCTNHKRIGKQIYVTFVCSLHHCLALLNWNQASACWTHCSCYPHLTLPLVFQRRTKKYDCFDVTPPQYSKSKDHLWHFDHNGIHGHWIRSWNTNKLRINDSLIHSHGSLSPNAKNPIQSSPMHR